jgi:hypothetical protein
MTPQDSLTLRVVDALNACKVPYLLAGSFASNYYGIPRSTQDADFVLQHAGGVGGEFAAQLGAAFDLDPQWSFETVTGNYRQYLRHVGTSFKIELFQLSADEHDQARFARRLERVLFDRVVWFLSPEDVVVSKLRWARSKDEEDVKDVLIVQGDKIDMAYVESWCLRHGTIATLRKIQRAIQGI